MFLHICNYLSFVRCSTNRLIHRSTDAIHQNLQNHLFNAMRLFLFLFIGLSTLAAAGPLLFFVSNVLEARVPT